MKEKGDEKRADFIKWFSELSKESVPIVGGKGANLAEIYNLKVPVPPGFVVTTNAYHYFLEKSGLNEKIKEILSGLNYEDTKELEKRTKEIRELIVQGKMPEDLKEEIIEAYENLNVEERDLEKGALKLLEKKEPIYVAVRSSATAEDLADASFAGQQDSFVNVKGNEQLLEHIKKCFASLYTARATYYRNKKKFMKEARLAAVVQRMINSDKSGVMFSQDPQFKNDYLIIEAVFGLGEGIVSGKITPDRYTLSRKDFKIVDEFVPDKKIALIRGDGQRQETIKLSEKKSKSKVLTNSEIIRLAELGMRLERHYKNPQDIEFAIEGEGIYLVQTRAVTTMGSRVEKGGAELKGEILLSGIAASPGIGTGPVKIVRSLEDLEKIKTGDILVTKMTNPDMVITMQKSAAVVTDEGGLTAHAAIVSREMGIPAVVGTGDATRRLKDGEIVTVDGSGGKVFRGKVAETQKKEIRKVEVHTKTELKLIVDLPSFAERASETGLKKVGLTRIEGIIAESGKHPNYFLENGQIKDYEEIIYRGVSKIAEYFDELWVRTSDIRSDEFQNLKGADKKIETNPMLGMHGIRYGLKHPEILTAELKALKRVAEHGKKIGILSPQIISVNDIKGIKRILREIEFTKSDIGVMVETPAAVQVIKDLCDEKIDFISFGTNDLTQYTLAIDRGNELVQEFYNEMDPAVLHQLEYVIRICKKANVKTSICGQAGSNREMVKFLIEKGIDSISVNADAAADIAEYVKELESKG
ncbi:MAG: phosphoenolpyruvate synthase [Candidatus Nanoarchaeia archaeon]|nr:phosphoenolpyruvate synthase [Candidatus Nanoarchaeia archaeon]